MAVSDVCEKIFIDVDKTLYVVYPALENFVGEEGSAPLKCLTVVQVLFI